MKKISAFFLVVFFLQPQVYTQSYLNYIVLGSEFGSFNELIGGAISTAAGNDGAQNINLPFPFKYMGVTYTTARISVNGWLEMGQSYTGTGYENQLESTLMKPFLCPLWDDLFADTETKISYGVTGEYPARIFVVQWKNSRWASTSSNRITFQIRLWEIDDNIDFCYGPNNIQGNYGSFSIGMNNQTGGSGNFISITPLQGLPDISTTNANNNINSVSYLEEGNIFSFTPVELWWLGMAVAFQSPDTISAGIQDQKIISVIVPTHQGSILTPPWITGFDFNTYGTTNTNDILNAKVYYTGSSPYFSTQQQLGNTYQNPNGEFTIQGFSVYQINDNHSYFWLAYDISPNSLYGNIIDGQCTRIDRSSCCPSIIPDTSLTGPVSIIVPVELISFTAIQNKNSVELSWTTKTELNNYGFEVHRKNLNNEWTTLTFVNGAGTTSEPQTYNFVDNTIKDGIYYYRLKQIDHDGSFEFSEIISVEFSALNSYSLEQNYPNPFNPSTNIKYSIGKTGNVTLKIFDIFGSEAAVLINEQKQAGSYEVEFKAASLSSGVYFYTINSGEYKLTRKMILIR